MQWKGKLTDTEEAIVVEASGGVISSIRKLEEEDSTRLPWISPGWIDLQVNGCGGYDLNAEHVSLDDVEGVTRTLHRHGVATYFPTVITGHFERMRRGLQVIAEYCRSGKYARESIAGIHLEGPYLSELDGSRGAHPKQYVCNPDWDQFMRLQDAANGLIKMVTLAPERDGALPFIEKLAANGIVAAIGHTAADGEQIARAVTAGATFSTHLGNGAQTMLPRHPNYIWHQLAEDRMWASLVPDGHHLAPPVLKTMVRAKRNKAIFVSDCTRFAGMPPGRYESLIGGFVELRADGRLHTVENPEILAGSAVMLDAGIGNAVRFTDMTLAEAVQAVTIRPAQAIGRENLGTIAIGHPATLTLFDFDETSGRVAVRETVVAGRTVYQAERKI